MKVRIAIALAILSAGLQAQESIRIENKTDVEAAQVIANIIAREIMDFDSLNVIIFPLPPNCQLEGAVEKNKCEPHAYTILINESISIKRLRVMLAHEFVHIKQYESEGLEIFGDIWSWNPDGVKGKQGITWGSMTFTGYETREFELDAFARQWPINKKLNKILKSRKP